MALGKPNRQNNGKAFSLDLRMKEGDQFLDCAYFEVQEKQGNEYVTIGQETDVAGDLIGIDTRIGEYEKKPIYNVTLNLKDKEKNEIYFTKFGLGSTTARNLANSILNLQAFENVQVGLYAQENKAKKKFYPAVALRQGGGDSTVKWKYDPKTAPQLQPRIFEGVGGVPTKDWTKVQVFLFEELAKLGEQLKANRPARGSSEPAHSEAAPTSAPQAEAPKNEPAAAPVGDDDPPF